MPKSNDDPQYCVHGLRREHIVSGGGSKCIGPFRWVISKSQAESLAGYYIDFERKFYPRLANS